MPDKVRKNITVRLAPNYDKDAKEAEEKEALEKCGFQVKFQISDYCGSVDLRLCANCNKKRT